MSNYEGKLGEWLKYVQQQVEAAKSPDEKKPEEEPKQEARAEPPAPDDVPGDVIIRDRLGRTFLSDTSDMDTDRVIGDYSRVDERIRPEDLGPALFDEDELPNVEDYLPFLKEKPEDALQPPTYEPPSPHQKLIDFAEGTGEPKPMVRKPEPEARAYPSPSPSQPAPARPQVRQAAPIPQPEAKPAPKAPAQPAEAKPKQKRVRSKIAIESRDEMIARLLDPVISLEEAARILEVCPTTVRRYTNRGVLKHYRTGGNQRRFKLSDVLAFLQASNRGEIDLEGESGK